MNADTNALNLQGFEAGSGSGARKSLDPKRLSIFASALLHGGLGLAIVLGSSLTLTPSRKEPRAIDLVSVEELLPAPPPKPIEPLKPEAAPLVAPPVAPQTALPPASSAAAPPPSATSPMPAQPDFAASPDPAMAATGGMALPTSVIGGAQTGQSQGSGAGAQAEPEYLAQFRITGVPVVPAKAVLANIEYPPLAARQGIEATVYLELFIDAEGTIRKITVLKDPGFGFAQAAVAALKGVACAPATVGGQAVAVRFRYPLRFALK